MALNQNHVIRSEEEVLYSSYFIPELWSQEVLAAYGKNLMGMELLISKHVPNKTAYVMPGSGVMVAPPDAAVKIKNV